MRLRFRRGVAAAAIAAALFTGVASAPAHASPAGQSAALSKLKADWKKMAVQQRKGTCVTFHKYPNSTIVQSTNKVWAKPASHKGMTIAEWLKVYKAFFAWAC